jgi:hypothetical protein
MIGEFRERWGVWPHSKGINTLFESAYEREEFSDLILLWEFSEFCRGRWERLNEMVWRGRDFEREYGIPLPRVKSGLRGVVMARWVKSTSPTGGRNQDPLHRVPEGLRKHVKMMRARKLSVKLENENDGHDDTTLTIPDEVLLWRQIEDTYSKAVSSGVWKPRPEPLVVPLPRTHGYNISEGREVGRVRRLDKIEKPSMKIEGGLNFMVREKVMVWKMVQSGELKLETPGKLNEGKESREIE